ncbi:MAG: hypothetical protein JW966_11770 [Anaerolineae bacterium]|nr:hypothetical protein [Anaerolineae bacterium]
MKHTGTIRRIQRGPDGIVLIADTNLGPRGITLDRETLEAIAQDAGVNKINALIGWAIEYDPEHGDLELIQPDSDASQAPSPDNQPE